MPFRPGVNDKCHEHSPKECRRDQSDINNVEMKAHVGAILRLAVDLEKEFSGRGCPAVLGTLMFHMEARVIALSDQMRCTAGIDLPLRASQLRALP